MFRTSACSDNLLSSTFHNSTPAERHMEFRGYRRANLDHLREGRESLSPHLDGIETKGQAHGHQIAIVVRHQRLLKMICLAHKFNMAPHAEP